MSIAVICPALNEEASVGTVVAQIPVDQVDEILVVDNGSTDHTAEVAVRAGATVISQSLRGYGAACLAGAQAAQSEILVFLDADGSFDPSEIMRLTEPLVDRTADLVLGSRTMSGTRSVLPHQRFGNWLATRLMSLFSGIAVTDLGPFRAIRRNVLLQLGMSEMTYGWPIEMVILAHRAGYRLMEVPVSYGPRLGGESKVSGTIKGSVRAGYCILATVARSARRTPIRVSDGSTGGSDV